MGEWTQPGGKADAYMYGDVVLYDGKVYVSLADTNRWMPDHCGWKPYTELYK